MADYGFLTSETTEPRVADVLDRKLPGLPEFVHAHPEETVSAAIGLLREYNVSQLAGHEGGAAGHGGGGGRLDRGT